jgi:hypothetical protein
MTSTTADRPRLWPEQWAIHTTVEADRLEHRLRVLRGAALEPDAAEEAVRHHVSMAREAAHRTPHRRWRGLRDRWRGTSVERAYRNLHTAKIFLVDLLPEPDVDVLVPDVSSRLAVVLDRTDPRRTQAERALRGPDPVVRRAALKQAMETAYDASDEEYARVRDFRNIILLTAFLIAVFMALLVAAVAANPEALPVCFVGDGTGTSTPYGLPVALAVLKVPAGALTAVAGLLLLGGGFAPGFSNLDSQRQILAYALVFGYAQQIATRLVDDRAQTVLNKVPSKDPEAKTPEPMPAQLEHSPSPVLNSRPGSHPGSHLLETNNARHHARDRAVRRRDG